MHSFLAIALPIIVATLAGQAEATSCNVTSPCPLSAPCCSEFGFCGKGHFCLGGCNPLASRSLDSCKPSPLCQDVTHTFANNSRILTNSSFFDGDAADHDWVLDKGNIMNTNTSGGELALILTEKNGGTRISSTRYVHYGSITARLKTGRWGGVITAFITMSDVKDEIDWEFPGAATTEAQSNFFWQGLIPDKTNGDTSKGLQDTYSTYHDYTINWQPNTLSWAIDGKVVRTIQKSDTVDPKTGIARYPNTPSRIQLSLWPAGIAGSPAGTVAWAGGMINWNDPDYKTAGQFYALVKSVTIKCSNQQSGPNITSYIYGGNATAGAPTVVYSNHSTLLNGVGPMTAVGGMHGAIVALTTVFLIVVHAL